MSISRPIVPATVFFKRMTSSLIGFSHRIESKENRSDFVDLNVAGRKVRVNETWLRHSCKCPLCFSANTMERDEIPSKKWLTSKLIRVVEDENFVNLDWSDGHHSRFKTETLLSCIPTNSESDLMGDVPNTIIPPVRPLFKSLQNSLSEVGVPYHEVMEGNHGVFKLLSSIVETGFGVIENVKGVEETRAALARISHPIRTFFADGIAVVGPDQEQHNDAAYASVPIFLHTDTSYFTEPMGLQMFHVLSRSGTGGQSCFSDGFLAAKLLYEENSNFYEVLVKTPLEFQYLEEGKRDFCAVGQTLVRHLLTGRLEQVRYNPRHITTLSQISTKRIQLFYEAFIRFTEIIDQNKIWIQLEPGTVVLIDNWRITHGRQGFTGSRHMASAYFPRSDWVSQARVLGIPF